MISPHDANGLATGPGKEKAIPIKPHRAGVFVEFVMMGTPKESEDLAGALSDSLRSLLVDILIARLGPHRVPGTAVRAEIHTWPVKRPIGCLKEQGFQVL